MSVRPSRILISGAGGFGTALGIVMARAGHKVTLWERKKRLVTRWRRQGYSDRTEWLKEHTFPERLNLVADLPNPAKYDWVVVATSMAGLEPTLRRILGCRAPVVLLQKGLSGDFKSPLEVAEGLLPETPILQFTGAAFARDLVRSHEVEMVISAREQDVERAWDFVKQLEPTRIWPVVSNDPHGLAIANALRTVVSFLQGVLANQLNRQGARSSQAIAEAAIEAEMLQLAGELGASKEVLDGISRVGVVVRADFILCRDCGSRNYALGFRLGDGEHLDTILSSLEGVAEAVGNIGAFARRFDLAPDASITGAARPYLQAAVRLIGGADVAACAEELCRRRERRFRA